MVAQVPACKRYNAVMAIAVHARIGALALALAGCVGDLDLPEPPSVGEAERAYDNPTAALSAANAEAVARSFAERLARLEQLGGLEPAVDALVRFDREVTVSDQDGDDTLLIRGVPVRTDALISIEVDCPGWTGGEPAVGAIELTVVVRDTRLTPVAWGPVSDCRLEAPGPGGVPIRVGFSAELIGYLPTILEREPGPRRIYLAVDLTALELDDESAPSWRGDLRLLDGVVELRVDLGGLGHLVVFGSRELFGVRAANGEWTCYTEERRCERTLPSPDSFSY
jgi:hypothetical protein